MRSFSPGLFDRLAEDDTTDAEKAVRSGPRARAQALDACKQSITRDLVALLNTRCAIQATSLHSAMHGHAAVEASVINYGLIDFAGMCMTSDTDQQKICSAVQWAIERHEPRLHKVSVDLRPTKGAINRVEFVISAQLKGSALGDALSFDAVFRPSLQQYSIERTT